MTTFTGDPAFALVVLALAGAFISAATLAYSLGRGY